MPYNGLETPDMPSIAISNEVVFVLPAEFNYEAHIVTINGVKNEISTSYLLLMKELLEQFLLGIYWEKINLYVRDTTLVNPGTTLTMFQEGKNLYLQLWGNDTIILGEEGVKRLLNEIDICLESQ